MQFSSALKNDSIYENYILNFCFCFLHGSFEILWLTNKNKLLTVTKENVVSLNKLRLFEIVVIFDLCRQFDEIRD